MPLLRWKPMEGAWELGSRTGQQLSKVLKIISDKSDSKDDMMARGHFHQEPFQPLTLSRERRRFRER
ncbi:hypothetical protein AJ78_05583 [Emergomyces pasteurianus Ep9510]|uniref:Uncharacterized protein n=1 Tax=Emergomyces pasteurianus Ep9510 TaxID=1447872 RepID=A0A1J9QDN2_9EURO|nr:hypothetical protein AJ78_05583 [Emergomyces pasteurianus Ep9510]